MFLPERQETDTQQPSVPRRGSEEYLSSEERRFIQRFLSFPEEFPPKFKEWLLDFIAVNIPQIPISQIVGFTQFTAVQELLVATPTNQSTTSTSYTDLTTVGPTISGLADGKYILFFGAQQAIGSGGNPHMSIQVNSTAANDEDAAIGSADGEIVGLMRAVEKTLSGGGNNTITAKYRTNSGTATFVRRWMIAQRIGN